MSFLSARKPERIVVFDFLAELEVLVITNKKCFDYFIKNNHFPPGHDMEDTWLDNGRSCMLDTAEKVVFFVLFLREHSLRVIVHECTHMVHQICEAKGIPLTMDNTEIIAYMTDYLVSSVMDIVRPQRKT